MSAFENRPTSPVTAILLAILIGTALIPTAASAGTVTVAAFSANTTSGYAPLTVQFTDASTFKWEPGSFAWDFEDDGTVDSTDQHPVHTYTTPGIYTVNLTVTDNKGTSDSEIKTGYIIASEPPQLPVADFSGTPRFGSSYVTVQFTDLSTNDPATWLWDFGDGETSTDQNPSHTFLGAGWYTVSLTATNGGGSDTETKTNYIYLTGASTRIRVIKYAADGTTILDEITIDNGTMEDTLPVMGDGTTHYYHQGPIFVDDPDPVTQEMLRWNPEEDSNILEKDYHAVKGTNLKDLCDLVGPIPAGSTFRVKATDGLYRWFAYRNVYNYSSREGPMVITWWRPDDGYVPYYTTGMRLIWFADDSTNPFGINVFGDWDWHEVANPNYWYWYSGVYPTTTGLSVQMVNEIAIFTGIPAPVADFKTYQTSEHTVFTSLSGDAPLTVRFIDWSTGDPTAWAWDFNNDGTTDSTEERPVHTFTMPGNYTVKLTVTNSAGSDSEIKTDCITVTGTGPAITVDATGEITGWDLQPEADNIDSTSIDLTVSTTASSWDVRVSDISANPHQGHMSQWIDGSGWVSGGDYLATGMLVKALAGDSYVGADSGSIILDEGDGAGTYDIWLKQTTTAGDQALDSGVYRVEITFTGSVN